MRIGTQTLDNPVVMAPLAGISNLPFRLLAKSFGAGLVCSEMVSANGLYHRSQKTFGLMDSDPAEKPLSIQIFGADPAIMAAAGQKAQAAGADIVDINLGCSVKKVIKTGAGVALMAEPGRAEAIFRAVRQAIDIPLTLKIRSGWDRSGRQAETISRLARDCGVDAVAVHPRTAKQGFSGRADWSLIRRIRDILDIPVIGNGDINSPADALQMQAQTGCDGLMVGRAAIGRPWLLGQIRAALAGEPVSEPDLAQRFAVMADYVNASVRYMGEKTACQVLRSRLAWFVKGLPHSSRFRDSLKQLSSQNEALERLARYQAEIQSFFLDHESIKPAINGRAENEGR